MHKILASLLASLPFSLSAMIGFFDMDVNFDPLGMKAKSHVDIAPQSSVTFSDKAWLLTPRFSIYLDGSFDVASATGLRHTTPHGYVGHHVFWSMSQTGHGKFYQVGHSLDFLTPDWDFRVNYYHPLTETQTDDRFIYSSHIWAETEALWKGDYFNVGLGPRYNFSTNCVGVQTRFVVPFKYFNLGAIVGYDYPSQVTFSFSFSFSLYNSHRSSQLHDPISHKSRVRYERVELPIHNKAQKPKKEANKGITENLGFIVEEPVVVHPPEPTAPPPKSLWNFFFEGQRNSE
jgi:hypothetical protein